ADAEQRERDGEIAGEADRPGVPGDGAEGVGENGRAGGGDDEVGEPGGNRPARTAAFLTDGNEGERERDERDRGMKRHPLGGPRGVAGSAAGKQRADLRRAEDGFEQTQAGDDERGAREKLSSELRAAAGLQP